jgi:SAP domain-containing protein
MSLTEFDNGYWYAAELKEFAKEIGIAHAGSLRKDELELAIKAFLKTGRIRSAARKKSASSRVKDVERGLNLDLPVIAYTNDQETKNFIEREARRVAPGLKRRSGVRYRLNRWREQQLAKGVAITYRDVVEEYVRLSQLDAPFAQIPHGRYINFVADFFAAEKNATRDLVMKAWAELKKMDVPKTYRSWVASKRKRA